MIFIITVERNRGGCKSEDFNQLDNFCLPCCSSFFSCFLSPWQADVDVIEQSETTESGLARLSTSPGLFPDVFLEVTLIGSVVAPHMFLASQIAI